MDGLVVVDLISAALVVATFGVVTGFCAIVAFINVVDVAGVPGAGCFLTSTVAGALSGAPGFGTALPFALTAVALFGFIVLLALAEVAGFSAVTGAAAVVFGLGAATAEAFTVAGFGAFEIEVPGAGTAGLSGTEGKRCAKMSAARVGTAVDAEDSCSSFFVITRTSSRRVNVAAGFTVT